MKKNSRQKTTKSLFPCCMLGKWQGRWDYWEWCCASAVSWKLLLCLFLVDTKILRNLRMCFSKNFEKIHLLYYETDNEVTLGEGIVFLFLCVGFVSCLRPRAGRKALQIWTICLTMFCWPFYVSVTPEAYLCYLVWVEISTVWRGMIFYGEKLLYVVWTCTLLTGSE